MKKSHGRVKKNEETFEEWTKKSDERFRKFEARMNKREERLDQRMTAIERQTAVLERQSVVLVRHSALLGAHDHGLVELRKAYHKNHKENKVLSGEISMISKKVQNLAKGRSRL